MSQDNGTVGDVVFGGSRFIFWCLAPVLLLNGLITPFLLDDWTPTKVIVTAAWCACSLLAIPAIYDARRFSWAARSVTAIIFLTYSTYLVEMFFFSDQEFDALESRAEASPRNALLGFIIIGVPCLLYTVFGQFRLFAEAEPEIDMPEDAD